MPTLSHLPEWALVSAPALFSAAQLRCGSAVWAQSSQLGLGAEAADPDPASAPRRPASTLRIT